MGIKQKTKTSAKTKSPTKGGTTNFKVGGSYRERDIAWSKDRLNVH